jgi:glycosyltransferase involved in cell wall biosynthesis
VGKRARLLVLGDKLCHQFATGRVSAGRSRGLHFESWQAAEPAGHMRVLHFFKSYAPDSFGGTQTVIGDIAHATAPLGVETEVLSLSRHPERDTVVIDGHLARKARLDFEIASTGFSFSAPRIFREMAARADVVHYHFPWPVADAVHFLSRSKRPSLVTYHSDIVRQRLLKAVYQPLMRGFLGDVGAIVATSPNYVATSPVLKDYSAKLSVIPLGARDITRTVMPAEAVAAWRRRLGDRYFVFVGALRYYKGLSFLLDAAARTGLPVVIVGAGEEQARLGAEIAARGLTNVTLLGQVSDRDKAIILRLATGFVFPSHLRSEAFGVSLVEAAASSLPLICCEIGTGTSFVNQHGVTGFVVPPADAGALADAMQRLWTDPARAAHMGAAARRRYEQLFTAEAMGAAYAELYRQLAETRRPAPGAGRRSGPGRAASRHVQPAGAAPDRRTDT